jgi:antitoxin VapB
MDTGKAYRPGPKNIDPVAPKKVDVSPLRARLISDEAREQQSDAASVAARLAKLQAIVRRLDALPILDSREPDEVIGYDENGLPT